MLNTPTAVRIKAMQPEHYTMRWRTTNPPEPQRHVNCNAPFAVVASTYPLASVELTERHRPRPVTVIRPPALTLDVVWRSLKQLPRYAELLYTLTAHRIAVRYKQSVLGPVWAILQPLALMLVYSAVFSTIARVPTGGHPFALFAYAGILPWSAFASGLGSASVSLVTHASLVTRVYFPRELLPLSYVASSLFDLTVASSVLVLMLAYYHVSLTAAALWVAPALVLLAAIALTGSLVLCAVHVRFRDVGVAMPLLLQVWMFASPVIYPLSAVPAGWRKFYVLNPMVGVVDTFRRAVINGTAPDPAAFGTAIAVAAVALPLAYVWFKQTEATMADSV
jgi:lipopolysaccharide transport system permease protein